MSRVTTKNDLTDEGLSTSFDFSKNEKKKDVH